MRAIIIAIFLASCAPQDAPDDTQESTCPDAAHNDCEQGCLLAATGQIADLHGSACKASDGYACQTSLTLDDGNTGCCTTMEDPTINGVGQEIWHSCD